MICNNCKAKLGCGCQKRVASDKTQCCSNCIAVYESGLVQKKNIQTGSNAQAPTNVKVVYNGPGKQH